MLTLLIVGPNCHTRPPGQPTALTMYECSTFPSRGGRRAGRTPRGEDTGGAALGGRRTEETAPEGHHDGRTPRRKETARRRPHRKDTTRKDTTTEGRRAEETAPEGHHDGRRPRGGDRAGRTPRRKETARRRPRWEDAARGGGDGGWGYPDGSSRKGRAGRRARTGTGPTAETS